MFLDYFLIILGAVSGTFSVFAVIYLVLSTKRSKSYRKIIEQETERPDIYAETSKSLKISSLEENPSGVHQETSTFQTVSELKETVTYKEEGLGLNASAPTDNQTKTGLGDGFESETFKRLNLLGEFKISGEILEKYTITDVISGGGMSKTFLALNNKLQNKWFIKYIPNEYGSLASEENILKLLNHPNLPLIADIFYENDGVYQVQRFIEGYTLEDVLKTMGGLSQTYALQWLEQMTQTLQYLHSIKPKPIIHCDLKPANIMVTPENNIVLIDFGISKFQDGTNSDPHALTLKYAAPEQFRFNSSGFAALIKDRFGTLPEERKDWSIDERTDIFSLGTIFFELITGQTPSVSNRGLLRENATPQLAAIIEKCLELDPKNRYKDTGELLSDIHNLRKIHMSIARKLTLRRVLTVSTFITVLISSSSIVSGAYIMQQENLSIVAIDPKALMLSEQESAEIVITKEMHNGSESNIDMSRVHWSFDNNVVKIDGNRIAALNEGVSAVTGRYRNKLIECTVHVIKPLDGLVNVSMKYKKETNMTVFAGNGHIAHEDGALKEASFVSPESVSVDEDGTVFVTDSGLLRKIVNGEVTTIELEPGYIRARKVRCSQGAVYILTAPWEEEDGANNFAIIKLAGDEAEIIYVSDADFTAINDFVVSENGVIYALEYLTISDNVRLKEINSENGTAEILAELDSTTMGLDLNGDIIYLAGGESGVIQTFRLTDKKLEYLAGTRGERHFIDGAAPLFYQPNKIKYSDDVLYVLDFNVLRKINLTGGACQSVETVAGEVSTDNDPLTAEGEASDIIIAHSALMEFTLTPESGIVLTDPKKGLMRLVSGNIYTADAGFGEGFDENRDVSVKDIDGTAYIKIPFFHGETHEQVRQALESIDPEGSSLIIDLRDNSGGVFEDAVKTANLFVADGIICTTEMKDGVIKRYYAEKKVSNVRIIVLVNALTASSAEMFAAALSESGMGKLLGTQTYGKSTIQLIKDAEGGKVTVGKYLTRNGEDVSVTPLKLEFEVLKKPDEDNQLERALTELRVSEGRPLH